MFNFKVSLLILAITGYFVARVFLSSTPRPAPQVHMQEYHVKFYSEK
jgi:Ni,Fe-hydrogenase I cytochrome b subunit